MNNVIVKLENSFTPNQFKEFKILNREILEHRIRNLNKTKILQDMISMANSTDKQGFVYAEIDAEDEDLDVDIYWLKIGEKPLYMYPKYIVLMKIPTGNKSSSTYSNEDLLLPHMKELYDSILAGEHISLDKDTVFKIVLDFFKTSKSELIKTFKDNKSKEISHNFDYENIKFQLDILYSFTI